MLLCAGFDTILSRVAGKFHTPANETRKILQPPKGDGGMPAPWFTFKPQPQAQAHQKPQPRFPSEGNRKRFPSQKPKTPPCLWVKCPTCGNDAYPIHGYCHQDHFPLDNPNNVKLGIYNYRCFGNMHRFLAPKDSIQRFRAHQH